MRRFVRVLKPSPAADIVDEDGFVRSRSGDDILQELAEARSPPEDQTASRGVGIGEDSAYVWIAVDWFSSEYCWCSVDIRRY